MKARALKLFFYFLLLSPTFNYAYSNDTITLHLARPSIIESPMNQYIHVLLTQALAQQDKQVNFIYSVKPMNKKRITEELHKKNSIDLAWLSIDPKSQPELLKTTLPIYKGLHGKRVLLINKNQRTRFAAIENLTQLKPLIGLQKKSWSDYDVLRHNGLTINGELGYKGMTKALNTGLADYFPRSVSAIEAEAAKLQHQNIIIEPSILLQYPSHYYFYTHKSNNDLLNELETGLHKLKINGEFERLYQQYFAEKETRLKLTTRKVFKLTQR